MPRSSPSRVVRSRSSSAPARQPSLPYTIWAWWRCGMTATTSTPSPSALPPRQRGAVAPGGSSQIGRADRWLCPHSRRTVSGRQRLVHRARGWAVGTPRAWPRLAVTDGSTAGSAPARLPQEVFRAVRAAKGAVLMQVPRRGYRESLSCQDCRHPARCEHCRGPLVQTSASAPIACRWCATAVPVWRCAHCKAPGCGLRSSDSCERPKSSGRHSRPPRVTSGGDTIVDDVEPGRVLVLATPGAEPHVAGVMTSSCCSTPG